MLASTPIRLLRLRPAVLHSSRLLAASHSQRIQQAVSRRQLSAAVALETANSVQLGHGLSEGGTRNDQAAPPTSTTSHPHSHTPHIHNNVTDGIRSKVGRQLHRQRHHPLNIIKRRIEDYFRHNLQDSDGKTANFHIADDIHPLVSTQQCFDDLFIPPSHPSRAISDTFYKSPTQCYRTHTSAHERQMLEQGHRAFLIAGDCYRRDEIDATHYPVFHQMEGVRVFEDADTQHAVSELKRTLEGLARHLFGQNVQLQWVDDSFPWTDPSYQLDIYYNNEWLEVLGCGILKQRALQQAGLNNHVAWAFGMGLDRLAMILFSIPDIRLFWTDDSRFLQQFRDGDLTTKFQPYSKYPECYKDITFWLPHTAENTAAPAVAAQSGTTVAQPSAEELQQSEIAATGWHDNDFSAIVREVAGDLVERIDVRDTFKHPKTGRYSRCYRIVYRDMSRSLTNEEVDELQNRVRQEVVSGLGVELR